MGSVSRPARPADTISRPMHSGLLLVYSIDINGVLRSWKRRASSSSTHVAHRRPPAALAVWGRWGAKCPQCAMEHLPRKSTAKTQEHSIKCCVRAHQTGRAADNTETHRHCTIVCSSLVVRRGTMSEPPLLNSRSRHFQSKTTSILVGAHTKHELIKHPTTVSYSYVQVRVFCLYCAYRGKQKRSKG